MNHSSLAFRVNQTAFRPRQPKKPRNPYTRLKVLNSVMRLNRHKNLQGSLTGFRWRQDQRQMSTLSHKKPEL
ncbi:hypothetical protein VTJ04DRAFT_10031 [Mycothermus thermophilus]|uniref:uncharacterized protein n=1 Tax=Humicola insolens TaxID=85995 RepID=UPI0037423ED5